MKTLVLRTRVGREAFVPLMKAAYEAGFRVGWLEWSQVHPLPEVLKGTQDRDYLFRSVAVDSSGVVATKRVEGEPVLKDLLREYFSGCRLVFVQGDGGNSADLLLIDPDDGEWLLTLPDGTSRRSATAVFVKSLNRPNPWG